MDIQNALDITIRVIQDDFFHEHYHRTVKVAEWAYKINTGYDQEDLVVRYRARETKEEKAQRVKLYNPLTPLAANQVKAMFRKLRRTDGVKEKLAHESNDTLQKIKDSLGKYYADQDLAAFLFDKLEFLTFFDPNAFVLTEWEEVLGIDGQVYTKPYPVEFYSHQVRDFKVNNGILEYVLAEQTRKEMVGAKEVTLSDFYLYAAGVSVHFHEISENTPFQNDQNSQGFTIEDKAKKVRYFQGTWWVNDLVECPGIRAGAYMDPATNGATFITPLHMAEFVFADLVRDKSLLDLSKTLHVFLQKYAYGPECEHIDPASNDRCHGGWLGGDPSRVCPKCHGSGVDVHTTDQEAVILKLPQLRENFIPLQDLTYYVQLPQWMPPWMSEQIDIVLKRVVLAVFTTEVYDQATVAQTATEKLLNWEQIYDTLQPYGELFSRHYMKHSRLVAQYLGAWASFSVSHGFPPDYRMESAAEVVGLYERAKAAGMSFSVLDTLDRNLLVKLHRNDPEQVDMILAFRNFLPFRDKSQEVLAMILADLDDRDPQKVLYVNFSRIETELAFETSRTFHKLTYPEQKAKVMEKVMELIEEMGPEKPAIPLLPFFDTPQDDDPGQGE